MTFDLTGIRVATALEEVAAEREKQRAKWGDDHDDGHTNEELADAAAWLSTSRRLDELDDLVPQWVFRLAGHRRRELIIAAALLVAEVERLDRATERESE